MTAFPAAPRPVTELRQYTLKPGRRDDLVNLFEAHFVDGQDNVGAHVVGQFLDLDDPNRFVWLRSFESMDRRGQALPAFYFGPVWQAHRDAANATMEDSDDVLLLRELSVPHHGAQLSVPDSVNSVVGVGVIYRDRPLDEPAHDLLINQVIPELAAAGADPVGVLVTEHSTNNFPQLPVRDENVIVWICRFDNDDAYADSMNKLSRSPSWSATVLPALLHANPRAPQQLRLRPTTLSRLR